MLNPYQMLGVDKSASQDEIKKRYRKLAKEFHPDKNPNNKEAEKKFKEISSAFELIGTPEARGKFDRGETDAQKQQAYEQYQQGFGGRGPSDSTEGFSFSGMGMDEDLFAHIFGQGQKARGRKRSRNFAGEDQLFSMEVAFEEAALGAEKMITLPNGKKLNIKIPAGIESGKKLRFKGMGGQGVGQGPSGDALVEIQVKPHSKFTRSGLDLEMEVPVSFFEAMEGADITVQTLDGQVVLKIPSGVSTGSKLKLKGKGAGAGANRGDLIAKLKVVMPKSPPLELIGQMKQLSEKYNYNPRI